MGHPYRSVSRPSRLSPPLRCDMSGQCHVLSRSSHYPSYGRFGFSNSALWIRVTGSIRSLGMFPVWVYLAIAFAIALVASAIGQIFPGFGVPFVALASTAWVAYSASRNSRRR
jgi:hypothetical protein